MLIENLINRGTAPVLEKVMSFTEARHEMLVNNVTNFDTVFGFVAEGGGTSRSWGCGQ